LGRFFRRPWRGEGEIEDVAAEIGVLRPGVPDCRLVSAQQLYAAGSLYEAQLLLDQLREAGLAVELRNENLVGMIGFLPESTTQPTIWLENPEDWERARAMVDAFEERRATEVDTEITCPACGEQNPGNFELCWKCRAALVD